MSNRVWSVRRIVDTLTKYTGNQHIYRIFVMDDFIEFHIKYESPTKNSITKTIVTIYRDDYSTDEEGEK